MIDKLRWSKLSCFGDWPVLVRYYQASLSFTTNTSNCFHEEVDTYTHAHSHKLFITSGWQGNMGHCSLSYVLTSERHQEKGRERDRVREGGEIRRTKEQMGSRSSRGGGALAWATLPEDTAILFFFPTNTTSVTTRFLWL